MKQRLTNTFLHAIVGAAAGIAALFVLAWHELQDNMEITNENQ